MFKNCMESTLSPKSKQKLSEILMKIDEANFDEFDISELLRYIRPFSKKYKLIWELACFIAHTEERTQGIIQEQLDETYANLIFGKLIKSSSSKSLDISQMNENLFKAIFTNGLKHIDANRLKKQTNLNKKEALKMIRDSYLLKDKIFYLNSLSNFPLIIKILNVRFSELGHQQILINSDNLKIELTKCLTHINNLLDSHFEIKRMIYDNFDDIKLCFMSLLHTHNFLMFDGTLSNCTLEVNCNHEKKNWELALYSNATFGNSNRFSWKIMELNKSAEAYIPELAHHMEHLFALQHFKIMRDITGKLVIQ